jgi:hypothetical protein
LKKLLDEIQKKHRCIKRGIENSTDLINEYCLELRTEVQVTAEEIILQVNDLSSKLIEEIIEFNKANKESLEHFYKDSRLCIPVGTILNNIKGDPLSGQIKNPHEEGLIIF